LTDTRPVRGEFCYGGTYIRGLLSRSFRLPTLCGKGNAYFIAWIGIAGAVVIGGLTFTPFNPRLVAPVAFVIASLIAFIAASSWLYKRYAEIPTAFPDAIARLAELGWTVKLEQNQILFEITGGPMPSMQESSTYFAQLNKSFRLHFQNVKSLVGLHYLADFADCQSIEINAGEFNDISELRGFVHLTKLAISQVPLNETGIVDASPLSSLVNLEELVLGMSRIRDANFLRSLLKLKRLYLGQTLVTDISSISALQSLEYLDIRGTRITDLRPLSENNGLKELSIGAAQIPALPILTRLSQLKKLPIIDQNLIDLSPVGSLANLESLFVWRSPQLDLSPLRNLAHLRSLQLSGLGLGPSTSIVNPQAIGDLRELRTLTLGSLQISDLAFVRDLKNLNEININAMPITSIHPLQNLKSLKSVSLADVPVIDISVFLELPNLTKLNLVRVPARADVLSELERRGVAVKAY
jgi:Leucine-rich repeat (LRR) protein